MTAPKTLRLAGVQVESRNLDVAGNLRRAEALVEVAAGRGAQLVLCPEFLAPGYVYHRSIWDAAEPRGDGPTERWLARMARRHGVYIGASYLEACRCAGGGGDFFNTFTLVRPDGDVAGRVRKQSLPGFEGWFFRGCPGAKVIDTPDLGRVGVGICWDNDTARFMRTLGGERPPIDLLLMPHSAPIIAWGPLTLVGDAGRERLRGVAGFYAKAFGVPTVMANKAAGEADSWSPVPCVPGVRLRFHCMGQSTICDAEGEVCDRLGEGEGVVFAEVEIGGGRERPPPRVPAGYWARPPRRFAGAGAVLFRGLEWVGKAAYALSPSRRRAARDNTARWREESLRSE